MNLTIANMHDEAFEESQTGRITILQNLSFGIATAVFGIMAGFFWTYTFNVNLAMLNVDGETYATVQSLFNQNVRHINFFAFFFGGVLFPLLALAINWNHWRTASFWMIVTAWAIYFFGVFLYTQNVNLPLNEITEAWDPRNVPAGWESIRDQWNAANALRTGMAAGSFGLGIVALMLRAQR